MAFSVVLTGPCIVGLKIYVWFMQCGWVDGVRIPIINELRLYYAEMEIAKLKNISIYVCA